MTDLETLSALLDGDLDATETAAFRARLDAEPDLAQLSADFREFATALAAYPEPTPPLALNAAVLGAGAATGVGLGTWALGGLLLGLVAAVGVGMRTPGPTSSPPPPAEQAIVDAGGSPAPAPAERPTRRVRADLPARAVSQPECEDFAALSQAAIEGLLEAAELACLEGYRLGEDPDLAAFASDLLMVQAWAADDKDTWRALAVDHVSAIEPERVVLMVKLAIDASKAGDEAIALATAEDALALPDAFDPLDRDGQLALMHRIRVASLSRQQYPADEVWQAASEWYEHNETAGLELESAERVCLHYGVSCAE